MHRHRATYASVLTLALTLGISGTPSKPADEVPGGVEVTPDGGYMEVLVNQTGLTATFQVKNTRTVTTEYDLSCSTSGNLTCSEVEPFSVALGPNESLDVTAFFSSGSAGSGTLTVNATGPANDAGYIDMDVTGPPNPVIALRNFNRDNRDRGLCLTSGAGEAAAWQCGDLLVSHGTPAYATLGRDRSITLVYNSSQAAPRGVVPIAVTHGSQAPNSVYSDFWINKGAGSVYSGSYGNWYGWASGTRQIVLNYNADSLATGAYPISIYVADVFTGVNTSASVLDTLLMVNRRKSRFGRGWSLAGVEELAFNQPAGTGLGWILWAGGEGSARLYRKLNATTWVAPAGAFRDTLTYNGTSKTYTRTLRHGIKVVFDSLGRHQQTVNRTGHATQFFWSSSPARLDSITVPPAGRPRTTYKFVYDAAGMIDSIIDPAGRGLNLTVASDSNLTTARDPEVSLVTSFQYDAQGRLTRRTSPRGVNTRYEYANGLRVTKVHEPYGSLTPPDTARTEFTPWDERGLALASGYQTAVDTGAAFTVIRGPRYPTIPDTARFYVDRWGAPTKSVNALGYTSSNLKSDNAVPALVTQLTLPNNRIVRLTYDGRGNLLTQRDSTQHLDGRATRVTSWTYGSGNTKDAPSQVSDPMSRVTYFWYDSLGITDSIKDPRGHRTRYRRFPATSGNNIKGLADSVTERQVNTWWESDSSDHVQDQASTFGYDTLGNVRTMKSALGVITTYARDNYERVTDVYDPYGTRQEYVYDLVNRVTQIRQYTAAQTIPYGVSALAGCDIQQVVCTDNSAAYTPSLPSTLTTTYRQTPAGVDSVADPRGVTRKFKFEARGQVWKETDEFGYSRSGVTGKAGELESTLTRDSLTIQFDYDTLGRRTRMRFPQRASAIPGESYTAPGDTVTYTYDNVGNQLTAQNGRGVIRREYYADGLLKKKVTHITSPFPGFQPDSLEYVYSLAGEIARKVHNSKDTTDYTYKANGDLDSLIVRWAGSGSGRTRVFTFEWDSLGRRSKVTYPPTSYAIYVTLSYDAGGTLRQVKSVNTHNAADSDRFDFTWRNRRVDAVGRIWQQRVTCSDLNGNDIQWHPCGGLSSQADSNRYTRLGMLVGQQRNSVPIDTMQYDASGNLLVKYTHASGGSSERFSYVMNGSSNRLVADSVVSSNPARRINHFYTKGGALERVAPQDTVFSTLTYMRWHYYDAMDRLTGTSSINIEQGLGLVRKWNLDACRYDPDGQLARPCDSSGVPWLLFDGNNVYRTLYGDDAWVFVHGPALDDPLIGRFRQGAQLRELYYVTDGKGRQFAVADSLGRLVEDDFFLDTRDHKYAGGTGNSNTFSPDRFSTAEIPGVSFFRNRAYDSRTGRWTQEDPIGLAGGANLYQFNGNNPVTYTDPFGLKVCPPDCPFGTYTAIGSLAGAAFGAQAGGTTGAILGAIGGGVLGAPTGPGAVVTAAAGGAGGAAAGGVVGAAGGAIVGGAVGLALDGVFYLKGEAAQIGQAIENVMGKKSNTKENRDAVGDYCEACKQSGTTGTKNSKGDFTFEELKTRVKEFFNVP